MEWIPIVIQLVTALVCPIWLYLWIAKPLKEKQAANPLAGHYTIPAWHFPIKRWWAAQCLKTGQKKKNERLKKQGEKRGATYISLGKQLPSELEDQRILEHEDSSDSISFYATDQKRNSIFIQLTRKRHRTTEVMLHLRLADGRTYQLPNHPDTVIANIVGRGWTAAGLKITPIETWRRWRITFNGLLRNGIRRNYRQDNGEIEHVRFNFIFIAGSAPLLWPKYWSPGLKADALAREPWKSPTWIDMIKSINTGGFDQWGSMIGQIFFDDSTKTDLFLRGIRQRRWGRHPASQLHRSVSIIGVTRDGAMYCLGAISSKEGLTHMQFGHIKFASEMVYPIDWMDFELPYYAEQRENIPIKYKIHFKAGGKKFRVTVSRIMDSGATFYGGRPWDWEERFLNITTNLNDDIGAGFAHLWYNYTGSCPLSIVPRIRHLSQPDAKSDPNLYVVTFDNRMCQSDAVVGGKGSSLASLSSIENDDIIVPSGFCVTVAALKLHIDENKALSEAITRVENISTKKCTGNLKSACEAAVELFHTTLVTDPVEKSIAKALADISSSFLHRSSKMISDIRYAVRSSAVGEDSEDTSAAGQNETFLGVQGDENVVKAVAKCWGSLFAYQSVEYRRQHGLPIIAEMGVCIQMMVNAEVAGVMFTRHPMSGDPREIVITANYGLGESIVSAMVEPDTIIVHRSWNDALSIKELKLGKKTHKILMTPDQGTKTEKLEESENAEICLSEENALRLSKLGITLERLFGSSRDIEWAIADGKIFLLQARPVTTLDAWTDFELIHELDTTVPNDVDTLSFANTGEVFPGATSPLTLSTTIRILDNAVAVSAMRVPPNPYAETCVCITSFRCYMNYLTTTLRYVDKTISLANKVVDIAISGHIVTTPEVHAVAMRKFGTSSIKDRLILMKNMFKDIWDNEKIVENAKILENNSKIDTLSFGRAEYLYKDIDDNFKKLLEIAVYHTHTSRVSVFCQVFAMSVLTEGSENFTDAHYADIALLFSSCSDVESAKVPTALRELAKTIKSSEKAEEFIKLPTSEIENWLRLNCTSAAVIFDNFLKQHGHRSIREFDFLTETWDLNPENLLQILQTTVGSPREFVAPEVLSSEETVARLKSPKRSATRWMLKLLVPLCRLSVARREKTKSIMVSLTHSLRLSYRRLGQLMVNEGLLPEMNLIFFLTHHEIGLLLKARSSMLVRKAVRRRKIYFECDKLRFSEIHIGVIKPLVLESKIKVSEGAVRLSGTPVCGGAITGRACVITHLSDASQLKTGDILITHCTDIGWSPYFPMIGGVVTELGGIISHGAVVAREYGLPCVVGVEKATHLVSTGDTVLLDGTTGVLQVVEQPK